MATAAQEWMVMKMKMHEEAIRELKRIKKFAPFFMEWKIDYIITLIKNAEPTTCGHCKYLTVQDDGVNYCRLYKTAKPWDGFCEKGEKR